MPTRNGRKRYALFLRKGVINIDNKKMGKGFFPLDEGFNSEVSNYYSKAYLPAFNENQERKYWD
jgi:queuine tRNA-ribosyltransferase